MRRYEQYARYARETKTKTEHFVCDECLVLVSVKPRHLKEIERGKRPRLCCLCAARADAKKKPPRPRRLPVGVPQVCERWRCHNKFVPKHSHHIYCSEYCRRWAAGDRRRNERKQAMLEYIFGETDTLDLT